MIHFNCATYHSLHITKDVSPFSKLYLHHYQYAIRYELQGDFSALDQSQLGGCRSQLENFKQGLLITGEGVATGICLDQTDTFR